MGSIQSNLYVNSRLFFFFIFITITCGFYLCLFTDYYNFITYEIVILFVLSFTISNPKKKLVIEIQFKLKKKW